jgi:hypothetical protein
VTSTVAVNVLPTLESCRSMVPAGQAAAGGEHREPGAGLAARQPAKTK